MEFRELTNEEFQKFSKDYSTTSIYQTYEYGLIMNKQKYETLFLGLCDNETIIAASLILIERLGTFKYAYAPRGFLIDYSNKELLNTFTEEIKKYLKKISVIAIKICPEILKSKYDPKLNITLSNPNYDEIFQNLTELKYYHLGYNNNFESFKPRFEAKLELNSDVNKLYNELNEEQKNIISTCDLAGIRIYKGTDKNLNYLYDLSPNKKEENKIFIEDVYKYYSESNSIDIYFAQLETETFLINTQIEYQKQINICNKLTDELFQNQGKNNNELINKKIIEDNKLAKIKEQLVYATNTLRNNPNGVIIASAMIIKQNDKIYLKLEGHNEEFKHLCPKNLLIWKIIEKYSKDGFKEFNLGGMTNPTIENDKYKNLNKFKLGFNSYCIEYAGDFELITHYPLYTIYRNSSPLRKMLNKKD